MLAAVILLIAGFVLAKPFLIMWSIVVSVLSALFLVIGALLRRHELFPGGGQAAVPTTPPPAGVVPPGVPPYPQTGPMGAQPSPRPHPYPRTATMPSPVPSPVPSPAPGVPTPHRSAAAGGISPDAIVLVIPGRKRYHVQACRQLTGRDHEELTYEEAREEGFTPCTACLPDAALGGRQLPPVDDADPAVPAAHLAEPSEPTRDLRPPVVQPKPAAQASTPAPEPGASPESGWFGRTSQSEGPSAPGRPEGAPPPGRPEGAPPSVGKGEPSSPAADAPDPKASRATTSFAEQPRQVQGRPAEGRPGSQDRPSAERSSDQGAGRGPRESGQTQEPPGTGSQPPSHPTPASGRAPQGSERAAQDPGRAPQGSERGGQDSGRSPQASERGGHGTGGHGTGGHGTGRSDREGQDSVRAPQGLGRDAQDSGGASQGSERDAQGSGRSSQRPGAQGAGRGQEQGKRPYASPADEPDLDSGPDTRPQPRVTADGTPVSQPPASAKGGSDRPRTGDSGRARTGDSGQPQTGDSGTPRAGGAVPAEGRKATSREEDPASGPSSAAGSSGAERSAARGEQTSGSQTSGSAPVAAPGKGGPAARDERGSAPTPAEDPAEEAEKTVRTRSLFEPASPAGARRPPSSAESAKAQGPLPKGTPSDSGPSGAKPEGGKAASGRPGEPGGSEDADATKRQPDEQPARPEGDAEARRSTTVKVIVGTRRYHSTDCPLVRGAGDSGVETMTRHQAETAGLTACSVCQHDRETVS
ncbi:hypothetical protein [Nonomuraea sp. NPDC048826]|uniref:hypothetical protein n=1 Tax=Nonomuraea sp. NPDC048826 TaxID=3364347 RepID=UPI00371E1F93